MIEAHDMAEIQFIVDKLNEEPFKKELSLVRNARPCLETPLQLQCAF